MGQPINIVFAPDGRHEKVGLPVEFLFIHQRPGGNNTNDFPLDDSFCGFRVFHLFTDRHLPATVNKFTDVGLICVVRDAAHGDFFAVEGAPGG